jgi:hypothetical protein
MYLAQFEPAESPSEGFMKTTLSRVEAESIFISVDGYKRKAYRCTSPTIFSEDPNEITWDETILNEQTTLRRPVYIQKHAIAQTLERLPIDEKNVGNVHYLICKSLREPMVRAMGEGRFLVDMRINDDKKVGYLVAQVVEDKILVKTFLLPTMSGTPEAKKFYDKLRLRRADIDYLGLSDFGELASSDLLEDEDIAKVFEECGCADLLTIIKRDCQSEKREGSAAQFRKYLGTRMSLIP